MPKKPVVGSADAMPPCAEGEIEQAEKARLERAPRDLRPVHAGKRHDWEPGDPVIAETLIEAPAAEANPEGRAEDEREREV